MTMIEAAQYAVGSVCWRIVTALAAGCLLSVSAFASPTIAARTQPAAVAMRSGAARFRYDLRSGTASILWGGHAHMSGFHSAVRVGGTLYASTDYSHRAVVATRNAATVTLSGPGKPTMRQRFVLNGDGSLLVRVELAGANLSSNWMAPIVADSNRCVHVGGYGDDRALQVPFDNDHWARYNSGSITGSGVSHEVAAFYDNTSRNGLVVGSVTHDAWKTGISFAGSASRLNALTVWGGIADDSTHDAMPHGAVTGRRIVSPTIWVGFFKDWRKGLEAFADANAKQAPRLKWTGGVPFGWNSWGKIQAKLNCEKAIAVSDFGAGSLQHHSFSNDGTVYINLDSFWDNLSEADLKRFVAHVRANGQKAGVYWAPFIYWGKSLSQRVEGSTYTYGDIVLRDASGKPISLDGGMAVDPTHPGTLRRIDHYIDRFRADGFSYIKLDFLSHGALEGGSRNEKHFDPSVETGIQAYNSGMRYLLKRIGGSMFISEAISPLFPYQYAHSRRVSCDSFGAIDETEYVMNSETYGWWMSGRLYAFNDPDHMVLEGHSANENVSRVTSAAIAGTVFLSGDDLTQTAGQSLAVSCLTNPAIDRVARLGKAFRPLEGNTGTGAADVFELRDGADSYLAVFNYGGRVVWRQVDFARAGIAKGANYTVTDLWTGRSRFARNAVTVRLEPAQATILGLQRRPAVRHSGAYPSIMPSWKRILAHKNPSR